VTLGIQTANYAEVASGLTAGEQIVVSDRSGLKPGEHVSPGRRACLRSPPHADKASSKSIGSMSKFSIANPYFVIVVCLVISILGIVGAASMPVDLFPRHQSAAGRGGDLLLRNAAAGYRDRHHLSAGALLHLANGIDHIESHSLLGVSMIRVFFQPGTDADSDVTQLSNLALADLKRLPPGPCRRWF
jgi:hypothetical protein